MKIQYMWLHWEGAHPSADSNLGMPITTWLSKFWLHFLQGIFLIFSGYKGLQLLYLALFVLKNEMLIGLRVYRSLFTENFSSSAGFIDYLLFNFEKITQMSLNRSFFFCKKKKICLIYFRLLWESKVIIFGHSTTRQFPTCLW